MVLMNTEWGAEQLLYEVTNPVRPRLLCKITNTSAHLFTGDTFEYLKPVSATETDVMLRSLGSGEREPRRHVPVLRDIRLVAARPVRDGLYTPAEPR